VDVGSEEEGMDAMRNLDDFLDTMADRDDEQRAFAEFIASCKADHARLVAEIKAQAKEYQAAIRGTVRKLADAGLTADQIADAVDQLFKN
jgi:hypothetical protein